MTKPKVFIGFWAQPNENFLNFKADGCNIAIGPEVGPSAKTQIEVHKKCSDMGLWYIDVPKTPEDLELMILDPWCEAIGIPDEPDLKLTPPNVDKVKFDAGVAEYMAKNKWIVDKNAGRKRMYVNFAGPKVTAGTQEPVRPYAGALQAPFVALLPPGSIISADWYPINQQFARYPTSFSALATTCLKKWFPGYEVWGYHEASDQVLDHDPVGGIGRSPTPAELREEVDLNLKAGVQGITWFTHKLFGGTWDPTLPVDAWDARTPEMRIVCRDIAAQLNGPIVEMPPDPSPEVLALQKDVAALQKGLQDLLQATLKDVATLSESINTLRDLLNQTRAAVPTSIELKKGL